MARSKVGLVGKANIFFGALSMVWFGFSLIPGDGMEPGETNPLCPGLLVAAPGSGASSPA